MDCYASSGSVNYFNGYLISSTDYFGYPTSKGASASIRVASSRVCDNGPYTAFNTSWVMIAGVSPGTGKMGYAQVGTFRYAGQSTYHFYEYNRYGGSGFTRALGPTFGASNPLSDGEVHRYWVQYSPSKGEEELNIDNSNIVDTPFDPLAVWNLPLSLQFFGESIYRGSDTPGYAASVMAFTDMRAQAYNNVFYPNLKPPTAVRDQSRFFLQYPIGDRSFYGYTAS